MSTEHPERDDVHLENATIEVDNAELYISPGARRAAHRLAYALVVVCVVVIAIGAANLLFTSSQVHKAQHVAVQAKTNAAVLAQANLLLIKQVEADCAVDADLAGVPVANALNGHPSKLSVKLISDFRASWHQKGCQGRLPPPDPSFVAGARFYHLPVN
jgi:hypothetical protein